MEYYERIVGHSGGFHTWNDYESYKTHVLKTYAFELESWRKMTGYQNILESVPVSSREDEERVRKDVELNPRFIKWVK